MLARLISSIQEAFEPEITLLPPVCYSDSQVVIYWVKGQGRMWKPFVENRVKEIRDLVPVTCWRHCPGRDNPADIPSRGLKPMELISNALWWYGPSWLTVSDREEVLSGEMPGECIGELRASQCEALGLLVSESVQISYVIDMQRYSSLSKLLRVTAFVLKFISILRERVSNYGADGEDTCERGDNMEMTLFIKKAELIWVKDVQSSLVQDRRFKEWRHQLQLFQDSEDIWRCGGRLSNADISYGMKHPVVLPSGHYLTELIVWRAHERVYHNGVKETLTEIRSRYWIVRGRAFVKKIISRCVVCRRAEGRSYDVPGPPPLPVFRVAEEPAFTFTGVDFAGPLYVKSSKCDLGG